jgi:hypothetical protein
MHARTLYFPSRSGHSGPSGHLTWVPPQLSSPSCQATMVSCPSCCDEIVPIYSDTEIESGPPFFSSERPSYSELEIDMIIKLAATDPRMSHPYLGREILQDTSNRQIVTHSALPLRRASRNEYQFRSATPMSSNHILWIRKFFYQHSQKPSST